MPSTIGHAIVGATVAWAADIFNTRRPRPAEVGSVPGLSPTGSPAEARDFRPKTLDPRNGDRPGTDPGRTPIGGRTPSGRRTPIARRSPIGGGLAAVCAAIAAAPDLDLLFRTHRTFTHSITATAIVALIAALVASRRHLSITRLALVCAAAHASHLLLDWLAADRFPPYGIQLFWPFSRDWYISGLDLFRQTARRRLFAPETIAMNVRAVAQEIVILAPIAFVIYRLRRQTYA